MLFPGFCLDMACHFFFGNKGARVNEDTEFMVPKWILLVILVLPKKRKIGQSNLIIPLMNIRSHSSPHHSFSNSTLLFFTSVTEIPGEIQGVTDTGFLVQRFLVSDYSSII